MVQCIPYFELSNDNFLSSVVTNICAVKVNGICHGHKRNEFFLSQKYIQQTQFHSLNWIRYPKGKWKKLFGLTLKENIFHVLVKWKINSSNFLKPIANSVSGESIKFSKQNFHLSNANAKSIFKFYEQHELVSIV